jgi:PKD repeat protein
MNKQLLQLTLIMAATLLVSSIMGQNFTRITDQSNPVAASNYPTNYTGAAWVDIDNDGDLDLHTSGGFLFENDGSGNFTQLNTKIESNQIGQLGTGVSWADFDNDGDIDCAIAGNPSTLFRNNGNGTFQQYDANDFNPSNGFLGWSCAWGDYDNNGYVDLVISHPAGFIGPKSPSFLFDGFAGGALVKNDQFEFSEIEAPYTVSIWSDFDMDNDYDLFIGSGPAGVAARDFNYINSLSDNGTANLDRMDNLPMGTDLQDGQVWNWIDYDNDGDLDGYLTNYGGAPNRFYQNNDGTFESITNELTFNGSYLANTWGDVDNDGDLDVFITGDTDNRFFLNNGDRTFTQVSGIISSNASSVGATLGDYDKDGDLDIFISGQVSGLYRNDNSNSNSWLNITLKGNVSNASGIGAKVKAKANINGMDVWQIREVSAQNSFNSHNSLQQHFGFGNAVIADSVVIHWPSGTIQSLTDVTLNQFINIDEPIPTGYIKANFSVDTSYVFASDRLTVNFTDISISDPALPITSWEWDFNNDGVIDSEEQNPTYEFVGRGDYSVSLTVGNGSTTEKIVVTELISISGLLPDISLSNNFRFILNLNEMLHDTFYVYNNGTGLDSISVEIDYGNVTSLSGIDVSITEFEVQPGDSQKVVVSLNPDQIEPKGSILRPKILFHSKFSFGNNLFEFDYQFRVPSVTSLNEANQIPQEFELSQNYPNPFNPSTTIQYGIPVDHHNEAGGQQVYLRVYDILGNEVATLVNEFQSPGVYSVNFNTESVNRQMASGTYIYQLRSGSRILTKKFILLK